jgi:hypothetical protein
VEQSEKMIAASALVGTTKSLKFLPRRVSKREAEGASALLSVSAPLSSRCSSADGPVYKQLFTASIPSPSPTSRSSEGESSQKKQDEDDD